MKAAYKANRNKGIVIKDVPKPKINDNELLVKVKKAAVCGTDIHLYEWNNWCENVNAKNPMVIGHEFSGEVVEVGENVKSINIGDIVAGETHIPCGYCEMCKTGREHICENMQIIGVHTDGAFAEYVKIPESCAWKLPNNTPYEIGAIYEPFGIAVHGLYKTDITGKNIAITGCGPIGLFAIQVAFAGGAKNIFAIDLNDYRLNLAKKMGTNIITINPKENNVVDIVNEHTNNKGVDTAIELSGSIIGTQTSFDLIKKGGTVILIGLHSDKVPIDFVNNVIYKEATVYGVTGREMYDSWYKATSLIESGLVDPKKVITHHFKLEETEKAIKTAQQGNCGKIIIDIE
jgi:threonine 3-dehydrogenase